MRTVVKAISPRRVVDGCGNEMLLRRPVDTGFTYLADTYLLNHTRVCNIVKKLKTQEEIMIHYDIIENTYSS